MKSAIKTIVFGAFLFVIAAFVIPLVIVLTFIFANRHETQFEVPGTKEVSITTPGRYYV